MRVLNVAEKNSVATEIVRHLSRGPENVNRYNNNSCWVTEFPFNLFNSNLTMVVCAVRGHLTSLEFDDRFKSWNSCDPCQLLDTNTCAVIRDINKDMNNINNMLKHLARGCDRLILWLDCDREGEAIAFEVLDVCMQANRNLAVHRAVFSALTFNDINTAINNLVSPNNLLADAVESRSEIDLRIGASFTRFLSLRYQNQIAALTTTTTTTTSFNRQVVSYGPCQFPTLGFVVDRFLEIENFVSDPFWSINLSVKKKQTFLSAITTATTTTAVVFKWSRVRLFERAAVSARYLLAASEILRSPDRKTVFISSVDVVPKTRWRPVPLNTVELCKLSSSILRIPSKKCLALAELLYSRGYISYPRTETDAFNKNTDIRDLVSRQVGQPDWGAFAAALLTGSKPMVAPRQGSHDDNAHPPIHPVKAATAAEIADNEAFRVYDLITRHFLACVTADAKGMETKVDININTETFTATGLVVVERNFLEIYSRFASWGKSGETLPNFEPREAVEVFDFSVRESRTEPPSLLTERELISLMDRHGIGTDATMHEHIQTIQDRGYAVRDGGSQQFAPRPLGVALVTGFRRYSHLCGGLDLSLPLLRSKMEGEMAAIARGQQQRASFISACTAMMCRVLAVIQQQPRLLDEQIAYWFSPERSQSFNRRNFNNNNNNNNNSHNNNNDFPGNNNNNLPGGGGGRARATTGRRTVRTAKARPRRAAPKRARPKNWGRGGS